MKFYKEHNRLPEEDEDEFVFDTRFFPTKQTRKEVDQMQKTLD